MEIVRGLIIFAGHALLLLGANTAGETAWMLVQNGRSTDGLVHLGRYFVVEIGLISLLWFSALCAVAA